MKLVIIYHSTVSPCLNELCVGLETLISVLNETLFVTGIADLQGIDSLTSLANLIKA